MRRSLFAVCVSLLLLGAVALAQEQGHLAIKVQAVSPSAVGPAPATAAKVIVVHWTNPGMNPMLMQDRIASTDAMGECDIDLPPGVYDIFVTSNGLTPAAVKREVTAGTTTDVTVTLKPSTHRLQPVH